MIKPKRGEVYVIDCGVPVGSEQAGIRPAVVIQNNTGNRHSPTTIVAMITSSIYKNYLPTHVLLHNDRLKDQSCVLLEQIRTISLDRFRKYVCTLDCMDMNNVDKALKISLSME